MSTKRLAVIAPAVLWLAGCAAVTTADGRRLALTSPDFRSYVEGVFREQNRVATDLAFALEEGPRAADPPAALTAAEERLQQACAGVNELATARRDNVGLGARRQVQSARTVPECERAASSAAAAVAAAK